MSHITDEQVEAATQAWYASGSDMHEAMRAALETLSTPPVGAETAWRYSINYGPDGEENWANVYDDKDQLVGNLRTHHASKVVNAVNIPAPPRSDKANEQLAAAKAALDGYDLALKNREHGGLAAHRCVDALRAAFAQEAGE